MGDSFNSRFNYDNIGKKIKTLARCLFIIGMVLGIIAGAILIIGGCVTGDFGFAFLGLLLILFYPFLTWISSWTLYGSGEMIDKICEIERNTRTNEKKENIVDFAPTPPQKEELTEEISTTIPKIFQCPICGELVEEGIASCPKCNQLFEWKK